MYKQTLVIAALLGLATAGFNDITGNYELMQIEGAPEKNVTQSLGDDKKKEKEGSMSQSSEGSEADDDSSSSDSSSEEELQLGNTSESGTGDDSSDSDSDSSADVQLGNTSESGDDSDSSSDSSEDVQLNRDITSSSSDADEAQAQLEGDDAEEEEDHSGEVYNAYDSHDDPKDGEYSRVIPPNFAADGDDLFMRSMIKQYALEGKNKDGSPNGQFWMDAATSRAAASEVLGTHKGLKGAELAAYLNTYF